MEATTRGSSRGENPLFVSLSAHFQLSNFLPAEKMLKTLNIDFTALRLVSVLRLKMVRAQSSTCPITKVCGFLIVRSGVMSDLSMTKLTGLSSGSGERRGISN
ncbi:hypothetical protein D3C84_714900 [compost metagenome]